MYVIRVRLSWDRDWFYSWDTSSFHEDRGQAQRYQAEETLDAIEWILKMYGPEFIQVIRVNE